MRESRKHMADSCVRAGRPQTFATKQKTRLYINDPGRSRTWRRVHLTHSTLHPNRSRTRTRTHYIRSVCLHGLHKYHRSRIRSLLPRVKVNIMQHIAAEPQKESQQQQSIYTRRFRSRHITSPVQALNLTLTDGELGLHGVFQRLVRQGRRDSVRRAGARRAPPGHALGVGASGAPANTRRRGGEVLIATTVPRVLE